MLDVKQTNELHVQIACRDMSAEALPLLLPPGISQIRRAAIHPAEQLAVCSAGDSRLPGQLHRIIGRKTLE